MNLTPEQLIQNYLVGAGVTVSNVTFNGASTTITSNQVGTFSAAGTATTQLGLSGGILMTSGKASIAIGPNNTGSAGFQVLGPGDPDLTTLSGSTTYDKAVIEFDFVPQFDTVRFRYVFGSEEFFEYCNQFNDAFGFFLSGPGITGTFTNNAVNIARMPGSLNNYVTINNVCANTASRWTNTNGQNYQYDGLTYVFTAWYVVQPCSTYHIKLAIGDAVDKSYDSGVFLEENSFSSPGVEMSNNSTVPLLGNVAVESCNDVAVNFRLMAPVDYAYRVNYLISGTAVNGSDYTHIDDYVVFPPGEDSINVIIHPIPDNIPEGEKTVILTLNQISCDGTIKRDTVYINDYTPMNLVPNPDTSLCFGGTVSLHATTTGGITPLTYRWNVPGTDSILTVVPPVGANTYTVRVTDVCSHTVYDTAIVTVHPVPVAEAGSNVVIPNGTSTTLHGSASGGYGPYIYSWTSVPPGFFSSLPEPSTGNLGVTHMFYLRVTDSPSGCESTPDPVIVTIEGGPLSVNPVSEPTAICLGDTARLFTLSGGGSGIYSYTWTSDPAGFSSTLADPFVTPAQTTTYHVVVNDGFNQLSGQTSVTVYPLPVIHLGPADTLVCIYDTVRLDGGNAGSAYLWSNGFTSRYLSVMTTGIGFDQQIYSLLVSDANGCRNNGTITITFSYDACVGIPETGIADYFQVYPNPAGDHLRIRIRPPYPSADYELINPLGTTLMRGSLNECENHEKELNVSAIPAGIYLLRLVTSQTAGTLKIVIR